MTQDDALEILKSGANVFLTGEPGSGKTHTINEYIRYLKQHDIAPSVTASTGIAATHIGGMTIHSWSGIAIKRSLSAQDLDEMGMREPLSRRMRAAHVLIIDEVSMLDGRTLAMVDLVCQTLRRNEEPFGGLQVVLVGDFFQLPPIAARDEGPAQFCFDSPSWARLDPIVCYLSEQHRQEDVTFLSTLTAIRRGEIDESVYECFEERRTDPADHPEGVPRLYTHNIDVDARNAQELAAIEADTHGYSMLGQGRSNLLEQMKKSCLSPEMLELKEGAAVMFTKNNFDAGYVNGTLGVVTGFEEDTEYPIVVTRDGETLTVPPVEWAVEDEGKVLAKITQVPLRLAWAITVHKSQGMSMDAAIMDLGRAFEYGQGYVALSRVRSLSGLHLLGMNQRALEVHPLVLVRDRVFRERSDAAQVAFGALAGTDLDLMQKNFVSACGGSFPTEAELRGEGKVVREKAERVHSREETRKCLDAGRSITEIVQERGLSRGTIMKHIEELVAMDNPPSIDHLKKELPKGVLPKVKAAFKKTSAIPDEAGKLTPVKRLLPDEVTFDDIRLARLFL